MKKKALILLSLIPFLIALFAFVTSSYVIRSVEQDIQNIEWNYKENTSFLMKDGLVKLNANPIYDETYPLSNGNDLIWTSSDTSVANIISKEDGFYLQPLKEGRSVITCSNSKKSIVKSFNAIIVGDGGAVIVNPLIPFSQQSISGNKIVGTYDDLSKYGDATFDSKLKLEVEIVGSSSLSLNEIIVTNSSNIKYNKNNHEISYLSDGPAFIEFDNPYSSTGDARLDFNIVKGFNIYDYDDLLSVTNKTDKSYTSILRVNLESYDNTFDSNGKLKKADTKLFGHLDENGKLKSFKDDVYKYKSTYNTSFIDQWNNYVNEGNQGVDGIIEPNCIAGIHFKGDIFGNGFTINTHNLVYPSKVKDVVIDGVQHKIASLGKDDLYRGPLKYVSLGNPTDSANDIKPIFALNGEDNSSFYIDDEIYIDDINLKGSDYTSNLTNYQYCGNVLNINADNVNINNSIIENGRNVVRSYSSMNLEINNSLIRNGMEFLFRSGANEYNSVDYNKDIIYKKNGSYVKSSVKDYFRPMRYDNIQQDYSADSILTYSIMHNTQINEFIGSPLLNYSEQDYLDAVSSITNGLTNLDGIIDEKGNKTFKGTTTLNKVFFANSGISAISLDTMAQGSFIENNTTSLFGLIIGMYMPFLPKDLGKTSYPTKVILKGDCRFYDWKNKNNLTYQSLIEQDIKSLIVSHGGLGDGFSVEITEDDYLPIKKLLLDNYSSSILKDDKLNLPFYIQGGGVNLSEIVVDDNMKDIFTNKLEIDPYAYSLTLKADPVDDFDHSPIAKYQAMKIAMLRAASNVMGFNKYNIIALNNDKCSWYNESLSIEDLYQ